MQRLSKGVYIGLPIVLTVLGTILYGIGVAKMHESQKPPCFLLFLAVAMLLGGAIIMYVMLYKLWQAIQGPAARTTPGKAVGFMFIPFFNIYWQFMAVWGWAKDYNALIDQRGLAMPRAKESLALTALILNLIPCANFVAPIFLFIFFANAIDCYNALISLPPAATPVALPPYPPPQA